MSKAPSRLFRIFETDVFTEDLGKLQASTRRKVESKLRDYVYPALKQHPYYGNNIRKLTGYSPPTWRYRIGDFRIFYAVDDESKIVSMLAISDRKDAY